MKLPTLLLTLVLAGSAGLSTQADVVDSWTGAGGAWTASNQPNFTPAPGGGGILYTDQSIDADENTSLLNEGATWTSNIPPNTIPFTPPGNGSGIYTGFYYTANATPAITLATTTVLSGVEIITLSMTSSGSFGINSLTLNYGGAQTADFFPTPVSAPAVPGFPNQFFTYSWTWDVSDLASVGSFSIDWVTPSPHTAYTSVIQTQAIPEPSTYALIGLGIGAVCLARFRARKNEVTVS